MAREQLVGEVVRRIRAQLEPAAVLEVARDELRRAAATWRSVSISVERGVRVSPDRQLSSGEQFFVDTVEREVDAALHTAGLLAENRRRLDQQAALLHAAQVVTSELEIEAVLERLVQEVTKLLDADAADCYLLDAERGVLSLRRSPRVRCLTRRLRVLPVAGTVAAPRSRGPAPSRQRTTA